MICVDFSNKMAALLPILSILLIFCLIMPFNWLKISLKLFLSPVIGTYSRLLVNEGILLTVNSYKTVRMKYYWSVCAHPGRKRYIIGVCTVQEVYLSLFIRSPGCEIYHVAVYMYAVATIKGFSSCSTCAFEDWDRYMFVANVTQFVLSIYTIVLQIVWSRVV